MIDKLQKYQISEDQFLWFDAEGFEEVEAYQDTFTDLIKISKMQLLKNKNTRGFDAQIGLRQTG